MELLDIAIIISIANLITEQNIVRRPLMRLFNSQNYANFSTPKRFVYDILSCWACCSVWVAIIYLTLKQQEPSIQYLYTALICMTIVDVIQKWKR